HRGGSRGRSAAAVGPAAASPGTPSTESKNGHRNDRVRYAGQPIAVVIAETLEAAREGAVLLSPRYEASRLTAKTGRLQLPVGGRSFPAGARSPSRRRAAPPAGSR